MAKWEEPVLRRNGANRQLVWSVETKNRMTKTTANNGTQHKKLLNVQKVEKNWIRRDDSVKEVNHDPKWNLLIMTFEYC